MLNRQKTALAAVAAAAATACVVAAAGAALAKTTPVWSPSNPAVPNAFTNTTPGLAQIALTNRNIAGTFVVWKAQFSNDVAYKFKISGKWSPTEVIPYAHTNTTPAAAYYTDLKGDDSELVLWKTIGKGGLSTIDYSQGIAYSNGTISWTKPTALPGGFYSETAASPSVLFPLNALGPTVIVAWQGPYHGVRYMIGTESGANGRGFTWGSKTVKSNYIHSTKTDKVVTSAAPALTEIVSGNTGTVYVFWKGNTVTAPIGYASTPDNVGTGLNGVATLTWTLYGYVPSGKSLAATTAAPAVSSANDHGAGPLLLAYKGPSGFAIRYQTLSTSGWSPFRFVGGDNRMTADGPALVFDTLANVAPSTSGRIYLHHYNG
jgi:hypothetical protein